MQNVMDRMKRWFETNEGQRFLDDAERDGATREAGVARRRELVETIADCRRRERTEMPKLDAVVVEKSVALDAAREALTKADREHYEAGMAAFNRRSQLRTAASSAEGELKVTADARLLEMRDTLYEAASNWHHVANAKARFETRCEFMEAHQVIVNREEIDALKTRVERALARVEALILVAEPREEDGVAAVVEGEMAASPILASLRRRFT